MSCLKVCCLERITGPGKTGCDLKLDFVPCDKQRDSTVRFGIANGSIAKSHSVSLRSGYRVFIGEKCELPKLRRSHGPEGLEKGIEQTH